MEGGVSSRAPSMAPKKEDIIIIMVVTTLTMASCTYCGEGLLIHHWVALGFPSSTQLGKNGTSNLQQWE